MASCNAKGLGARSDIERAAEEIFKGTDWHIEVRRSGTVDITGSDGSLIHSSEHDYRDVAVTGSYPWWSSEFSEVRAKIEDRTLKS